MPRSMTGYGRAEATFGGHRIEVEIKCQNHRFKDIIIRLPKFLQPLEAEVKSLVAREIQRGRIEVGIFWDRAQWENSYRLEPNLQFITQYLAIANRLREEFGLSGTPSVSEILKEPDAISRVPEELDPEEILPTLLACIEDAIGNANAMKEKEGEFLKVDLLQRLTQIEEGLLEIRERARKLPEIYRERLGVRIKSLMGDLPLEPGRLEMEAALIADRCDITEELTRTYSHLTQLQGLLDSLEPVGRKLEFLIQEIHREVTTMANKAQDASVSKVCVEIKAELEKLREQVQNIE
ncbi:MAG: YicC/YloC family endoribonuclease [Desulfatiglandales bacterium]